MTRECPTQVLPLTFHSNPYPPPTSTPSSMSVGPRTPCPVNSGQITLLPGPPLDPCSCWSVPAISPSLGVLCPTRDISHRLLNPADLCCVWPPPLHHQDLRHWRVQPRQRLMSLPAKGAFGALGGRAGFPPSWLSAVPTVQPLKGRGSGSLLHSPLWHPRVGKGGVIPLPPLLCVRPSEPSPP